MFQNTKIMSVGISSSSRHQTNQGFKLTF